MRIAVVEDNETDRNHLISYLHQYEKERQVKLQIKLFSDGDDITSSYTPEYDLILMDIEMTFLDGMSAARYIRQSDEEVGILFITNVAQLVSKGYEVDALDYLLKPVSYPALVQRLDKMQRILAKKRDSYITIPTKGGFKRLETSLIRYIEMDNRELIYHTLNDEFLARGTLKEAEEQLNNEHFFRCNKCYLVNLEYIDSMDGNDIQLGDETLQVSRAKKKPLLDALNNYYKEEKLL